MIKGIFMFEKNKAIEHFNNYIKNEFIYLNRPKGISGYDLPDNFTVIIPDDIFDREYWGVITDIANRNIIIYLMTACHNKKIFNHVSEEYETYDIRIFELDYVNESYDVVASDIYFNTSIRKRTF